MRLLAGKVYFKVFPQISGSKMDETFKDLLHKLALRRVRIGLGSWRARHELEVAELRRELDKKAFQ